MTPCVVRSRGGVAVRPTMMTPRRAAASEPRRHNTSHGPAPGTRTPAHATPEEVAATYRRLAKEWHPDRGGGAERMAEINAAYELLRAAAWTQRHEQRAAPGRPSPSGRGAWLPPAIRRALGHELLGAVEPGERIWLVTPTTTWASPQALLAASDRRLLWLLDDAVGGRVQSLRFAAIEAAEHTLRRPRKRVATLRVRARNGRRFAFGELRPATAAVLTRRIASGGGAAVARRT